MYEDYTGMIFYRNGSYWKVIGKPYNFSNYSVSYPAIKSSKTGKEYRETNGFDQSFIFNIVSKYKADPTERSGPHVVRMNSSVGIKANIDAGVESAKKKNRINYLRGMIEQYQRELRELDGNNND